MELVLTAAIQSGLRSALESGSFETVHSKEAKQLVDFDLSSSQQTGVSWPLLQDLAKHQATRNDVPYFHELLKNTQVYHAPKPEKKVDPEFAAYMDRLRAEEKERQYKAMIASAVPMRDEAAFSAKDIKEVKSHLATMANIGFSMVAIYFVVYLTSRAIFDDIGYRVLLGLGGAIGICIVEVLLYLSYINPVAREKPTMKLKQKKLQ